MRIAKVLASRSVLPFLCLSFVIGSAWAEPPASEEPKIANLTLVKKPWFTSTHSRVKEERKWLSGVRRWTDDVRQTYVVVVPGSEGYPARPEQRQRSVSVAQEELYCWEIATIKFLDMNLQPIDAQEAQKRIVKEAAFLVASSEGEITAQDRKFYNQRLVIVRQSKSALP